MHDSNLLVALQNSLSCTFCNDNVVKNGRKRLISDSFEDFFGSQDTYNLAYSSLSLSIFFVATKTKTELAVIIAFGTPVMAYRR